MQVYFFVYLFIACKYLPVMRIGHCIRNDLACWQSYLKYKHIDSSFKNHQLYAWVIFFWDQSSKIGSLHFSGFLCDQYRTDVHLKNIITTSISSELIRRQSVLEGSLDSWNLQFKMIWWSHLSIWDWNDRYSWLWLVCLASLLMWSPSPFSFFCWFDPIWAALLEAEVTGVMLTHSKPCNLGNRFASLETKCTLHHHPRQMFQLEQFWVGIKFLLNCLDSSIFQNMLYGKR